MSTMKHNGFFIIFFLDLLTKLIDLSIFGAQPK